MNIQVSEFDEIFKSFNIVYSGFYSGKLIYINSGGEKYYLCIPCGFIKKDDVLPKRFMSRSPEKIKEIVTDYIIENEKEKNQIMPQS